MHENYQFSQPLLIFFIYSNTITVFTINHVIEQDTSWLTPGFLTVSQILDTSKEFANDNSRKFPKSVETM